MQDGSFWSAGREQRCSAPALEGDHDVDVLIVGAGYCGLCAAIALRDKGISVAVIDRHQPGWGASGRNGGQVIPGFKPGLARLMRQFGASAGERLFHLGQAAPAGVQALVSRFGIDCGFRREGWIRAAHSARAARGLRAAVAEARAANIPAEFLSRENLRGALGDSRYCAGLLDPRGATLDPYAYVTGLARGAAQLGAILYGGTEALEIDRVAERWKVRTNRGTVTAAAVGVATDGYTHALLPALTERLVQVGSYQIATRALTDPERSAVIRPGVAASDTRRLLRYFRLSPDGRLLMGGRGGFTAKIRPELYAAIERSIAEIYPPLAGVAIEHRWEGMVALTRDGLPRVMKIADDLWFAGGFNGRGVAVTTLVGELLAQALADASDRDNPLLDSPLPRYPLHRFRIPAMNLIARVMDMRDRLGG
jgi:glycine/D-amino acid oxidase-like deaminating enzyme